ncbi:MAG: site-specific integrase [Acidobacteria bacterium]|nr:site-specific integrase [Acidobacteriota bacterium]
MASLNELFEQFLKLRHIKKNITDKTDQAHRQAWTSFTKNCPHVTAAEELNEAALDHWLAELDKTTIRPTSINCYARSLNAFFNWLHEKRHIPEKLKIEKLATDKEVKKLLPQESLEALWDYKPEVFGWRRIRMLVLLIVDTGMRITEALNLRVPEVDFDNFLIKVTGKGRKDRMMPFSDDLYEDLSEFINSPELEGLPPDRFVFCSLEGRQLRYDNLRRDYKDLCGKLGIERLGAFHRMRHSRATDFIKKGGSVAALQRILGHEELRTTMLYVHLDTEDLKKEHDRVSRWAGMSRRRRRNK